MAHFIPAQFLSELDFQQYAQNVIERILLFADLLRKNRVPVHTAKELDAIAALQHIDMSSLAQFYMALKATMLVSNKYYPIFDRLFHEFWTGGPGTSESGGDSSSASEEKNEMETESAAADDSHNQQDSSQEEDGKENETRLEAAEGSSEEEGSLQETSLPTYSLAETLREKDFENIRPAEFAEFDELFKSLKIKIKEKRGRRFRASNNGKIIDLPRSIRQSRQKGGEIVKLYRREKKPKHSKLVLLADVSASMDVYSTFLIKFIYELQKHVPDTEIFVFGTQLKRITDILSHRSVGSALAMLSRQVLFWSGGTDIGGSFRDFNVVYGGKLRKKSRILVILSDGWDTGDIDILGKQMAIFRKGFRKIIWLNPNLKYDSYQPLCLGMAAAMPYIDFFLPCHNLKTLEKFIEIVKKI